MEGTLRRHILTIVSRTLVGLTAAVGTVSGSPALAAGHGGGGHGGGGGHMGGGGFHGGGHFGGGGFHHRGFGFGGYYPGFFGLGGYGFGYPGYGLGYGYGYPGYDYGYSGYGYGYYPGYTYGTSYYNPSYYSPGYVAPPGSDYTYLSAYGTEPLQTTAPGVSSAASLPSLGIDEQGVGDATGRGIRVARVYPGSAAERAGLQVGDVILSANSYLTQEPGNLIWIINHHAPNGSLNLSVRKASSGQSTNMTALLR